MKKIVTIIIFVVAAVAMRADDKDYIQVDWYPLCTDSVGWNIYTGGFVLGWDNASGIDVNMGRSIDIGWLNVIGTKFKTRHGQRITAGVGIDWRNYKLHNDKRSVRKRLFRAAISKDYLNELINNL